ncbi:MAG: hypothetical protein ACTSX6_03185 [Candidatus Heimdallarchaeaceae archaeon]
MRRTHLIITIGIFAVFLGSIAIGIAFSANDANKLPTELQYNTNTNINLAVSNLNETEVEQILQAIPEINDFLANFEEVELYLYYDSEYKVWYAFYFALDDYISYAFVIIDDASSEVLSVEVYIASEEANLTEQEVLSIALANEKVQDFIGAHPNYESYVYYDYFQYWYIDFYDEYYYSWCSVVVDDLTSEVIEVFSSDDFYETNLSVDEVVALALADSDVQQFITDYPDYEIYVYLTEFYDSFDTEPVEEPWGMSENLTWVVGFYSSDFENWLEVWIDDSTGEMIDKWMTTPATRTEADILSIANATQEVQDFLTAYTNVEWDLYYDGFGTWYVWLWSTIQVDAYIYMEIDDITGEILYRENYFPIPPTHTEDEVLSVILSLPEVVDFMNDNSDYEIWVYFFDGFWYVDVYSNSLGGGLWITLDDSNLAVVSIESYDCWFPEEPVI